MVYVGVGEVENVIWRKGWLKTSECHHMGEVGLILLKKPSYDIWTLPWREIDASVMLNVREKNKESSIALRALCSEAYCATQ